MQKDPYLLGNYAPIQSEITSSTLKVIGEIPKDLRGVFARNGANPKLEPKGRYHWFDGDGMIHAMHFEEGKVTYRNRWVRTPALAAEEAAGHPLWTGIMEPPDFKNPRGPFKNTGNTDLVYSGNQLLALWWMCGEAFTIKLPELETIGIKRDGYGKPLLMTAHPKVDPITKETMFIEFGLRPPYLHYMVLSAEGELAHKIPVVLPGPRLQHDIAITRNYTILMDLPLYNDPAMMKEGKTRVRFYRDQTSRFAVIPRYGTPAEIQWFDATPCYIYHTINAWEEGDEIVMLGCKIENPLFEDPSNPKDGKNYPRLGVLRLDPIFYQWRFNLKTGHTKETALDDVRNEFPRINNNYLGQKSRYSYNPRVFQSDTLQFDGVIKYDLHKDSSQTFEYPKGWFGGEVCFAPKTHAKHEDDGYLTTFVTNEASGESELYIFEAAHFDRKPIARIQLPQRVPTGYHSWWVSQEELDNQVT
jgi:carotenoid cleavage dioxygenase-like enzyme